MIQALEGSKDVVPTALGDQQWVFILSIVQPGLAGLMDGSISSQAS